MDLTLKIDAQVLIVAITALTVIFGTGVFLYQSRRQATQEASCDSRN